MGFIGDFASGWAKGGIPGGIGGVMEGRARKKQHEGLDEAQAQLGMAKDQAYQRRMADLQQAMQFYAPAAGELKRLYGMDMPMPQMGGGGPGPLAAQTGGKYQTLSRAANAAMDSKNALGTGIGNAPRMPGMGAPLRRVNPSAAPPPPPQEQEDHFLPRSFDPRKAVRLLPGL